MVPDNASDTNVTSYRELGLVEKLRNHMDNFTKGWKGFEYF